jgi:hypothetical protein
MYRDGTRGGLAVVAFAPHKPTALGTLRVIVHKSDSGVPPYPVNFSQLTHQVLHSCVIHLLQKDNQIVVILTSCESFTINRQELPPAGLSLESPSRCSSCHFRLPPHRSQ